jgi:hypothetical protein
LMVGDEDKEGTYVIADRPEPPSLVSYNHNLVTSSRSRYLRYSWFFLWLTMLARWMGLMAMSTSVRTRLSEAADLDLDLGFASGFLDTRCVSLPVDAMAAVPDRAVRGVKTSVRVLWVSEGRLAGTRREGAILLDGLSIRATLKRQTCLTRFLKSPLRTSTCHGPRTDTATLRTAQRPRGIILSSGS